MEPQKLLGFGQLLESDFAIPGAIAAPATQSLSAIKIVRSSHDRRFGDLFSYKEGEIIYAPVGVATFCCTGDRISVATEDGAEDGIISELLIANAIPASMWQQGSFMLHASGIQLPGNGGTVAIAGQSGSGKSTIAKALLGAGASLVGDDSLKLDRSDAGYRMAGLPGGMFNWSQDGTKRIFESVSVGVESAELSAIIVLGERVLQGFELTRCNRMQSVELLLAHRHRAVIADLLGRRQSMLDWVIEAAVIVPVFIWRRAAGAMDISDAEIAALRRALEQ